MNAAIGDVAHLRSASDAAETLKRAKEERRRLALKEACECGEHGWYTDRRLGGLQKYCSRCGKPWESYLAELEP